MHSISNKLHNTTLFGLLRHGETIWNQEKRIQGQQDSPLTHHGRQQLQNWVPYLKKCNWDRIVASDLGRVQETVNIINKGLGLPVTYEQGFREFDWGRWEGMKVSKLWELHSRELEKEIAKGWEFRAPDGETRTEANTRALKALMKYSRVHEGEKILLVCHLGIIKGLIYHIANHPYLPNDKSILKKDRLHTIECSENNLSIVNLNLKPPRES